jgi:RNA polymerase sigma-70 factor (ECF subfamily)
MPPVDERPAAVPDLERDRFERCFREHYPSVLAFSLRRIADRETAKDAAAETFAVAWRRRERIPDPALSWLYAVALRVIANQYRSAQRRRNLGARLEHEVGIGAAESDPADALDRRDAFSTAFARLTESEREVLRLIAWDGLDTRDAARAFGCRREPSGCGCTGRDASWRNNCKRPDIYPVSPATQGPSPPRRPIEQQEPQPRPARRDASRESGFGGGAARLDRR